jgi:peptide/nickel transport system permease protein
MFKNSPFISLLLQDKTGLIGLIVLVAIMLMSFVGPYLIPLDNEVKLNEIYQVPSWHHLLGTDNQGRDIFSQIVHGGRDVLIVAILTGLLSTILAFIVGAIAGFMGGKIDSFLMWIVDVILTIPRFPILAVIAAFITLSSVYLLSGLLAILSWPALARAVRSMVLSIKTREYIDSAKVLDLGTPHIVFREILPNILGYIVINFIFAMTAAVYSQVGLVFLGLIPLSGQNWGLMIQLAWTRGAIFYPGSLSYILSPIIIIALFQWSAIAFTRSLEEVFNPRLRGRES